MPFQVAERLEGAPGCAQFPQAFRDLHSQVHCEQIMTSGITNLSLPLNSHYVLYYFLSFAGCGQLLRLASCRLVSYPQSLPPLVVRLA